MKTKHLSWMCLIILLLSLGVTTLNLVKVFSSTTAVVSVSPQRIMVPPGQNFTINILVANVEGLNAWQFKLIFDPSVLYTNSTLIKEGPFLKSVGSTQFNKYVGPYYILVGCALTSQDTKDGNGTLAYVTFQVIHEGCSFLDLVKVVNTDPYDVSLWDVYAYDIPHTAVDGYYFSNFNNVAVTDVAPFPTIASVGESVSINATVRNEGNTTQTFDVTVYYNNTVIGTPQTVTNLTLGAYTTLTFHWDTTGLAAGLYEIEANASVVQGETYTADNGLVYRWVRLTLNPAALFTFSPSIPAPGQIVTFNASDSFSPNGNILNYTWNFGDGNKTAVNSTIITHVYTTLGIYTVTLNVTDEVGKWDPRSKTVGVGFLPEASFTFSPAFPLPGQIVTFNASASVALNGAIVSYKWNFGDGNMTTVTSNGITHIYKVFGIYTVTLNVIDNLGMGDTESQSVTVRSPPTASFSFSPATPKVNEVVTFNASASFDADGSIATFVWSFGDGETGTGSIATHAYTSFGTYTVTLNVTDNDGLWDTYTESVTVKSPPKASFTFSPATPKVNEIVTFNASASFDPDGSIDKYAWTFGDGGIGAGKIATHVYDSFGTYTVTLRTTDNEGFWDAYTKTVTVKSPPTSSFTFSPANPTVNEVVTFDASASSDPDGSIVSYKWDFGDGNVTTVSDSTITHAYAASQSYTVTLTVTDNDGFTGVQTTTVPVEAPQTNILLYVGVAVIIVIAAALLFYFGRRKH